MTQHPDEGTLHAYIDGELPGAEATALEAHVAGCASCSAALAEARGLVAATSQVITALDAAPAAARPRPAVMGHAGTSSARARATRPLIFRMPYARAAALLLLIGGSAFVADRSGIFDGSARSQRVSTAADAVQPSQPAVEAAPETATSAAASTPVASAPAERSSAAVGSTMGTATRTAVSTPRVAANRATGDGARAMEDQPAAVATDSHPTMSQLNAPAVTALKRVESTEGTRAHAVAAVSPAPPMAPPPPARALDAESSEALIAGAATPGTRVSRYRTKAGAILTLTEEPLRTSFAEESEMRRTAAATSAQRPVAAPTLARVVNTYRWSSPEQARSYTLTGPLPVAELEALSRRLSELERLP